MMAKKRAKKTTVSDEPLRDEVLLALNSRSYHSKVRCDLGLYVWDTAFYDFDVIQRGFFDRLRISFGIPRKCGYCGEPLDETYVCARNGGQGLKLRCCADFKACAKRFEEKRRAYLNRTAKGVKL